MSLVVRSEPVPTEGRLGRLSSVLGGMRGVTRIQQLIDGVPADLCRCGFERAWISRVDRAGWQFAGGHARGGAFGAAPTGSQPLLLDTHEAEALRRRGAVRVVGAAADPAVDVAVATMLTTDSYLVVPVMVEGRAVGLLHAEGCADGLLGEGDREVLALFAAALGHVVQRVALQERFERLRADMRAMTGAIAGAVEEACDTPTDLLPGVLNPVVPPAAPTWEPARGDDRLAALLTVREREVLRLMAGGETNRGIAAQLVISEGTVKSHVKRILRKLHATNRAQAVARSSRIAGTDRL